MASFCFERGLGYVKLLVPKRILAPAKTQSLLSCQSSSLGEMRALQCTDTNVHFHSIEALEARQVPQRLRVADRARYIFSNSPTRRRRLSTSQWQRQVEFSHSNWKGDIYDLCLLFYIESCRKILSI